MNALWICMVLALVSPIFAEEAVEAKKQDKRGAVGLGYGLGYGNYLGGHGYGYNGYGLGHGLAHGYAAAPTSYASLSHAPVLSHASYGSPLALSHGYTGYSGYHAPAYHAPLRYGYSGLGYSGVAHGLPYQW